MEAAVEAVVQNIIVNSPLVQRRSRPQESPIKFLFKEDPAVAVGNKNSTTVAAAAPVSVFDETQKTRKKKNHNSIRNFFGGMITSVRNVMNQLITSPLDNSIPLMDCVAARGEWSAVS